MTAEDEKRKYKEVLSMILPLRKRPTRAPVDLRVKYVGSLLLCALLPCAGFDNCRKVDSA